MVPVSGYAHVLPSSLYIFTKLFLNLVDGKFGVFESYVDELTFFFYMAIIYTYCGKSSICNTQHSTRFTVGNVSLKCQSFQR